MSSTTTPSTTASGVASPVRRNGVDTAALFATIDAVRAQPGLADFRFRAHTRWVSGTFNRTTIGDFHGAGTEQHRDRPFTVEADHPAVLVGEDRAPTPAEHLLQALGSCLMSGLANIAAARGVELGEVTAEVEGDIDLRGILGIDPDVRNGFSGVRVTFRAGVGTDVAALRRLVEQAQARSAVYDTLTRGTAITIGTAAA